MASEQDTVAQAIAQVAIEAAWVVVEAIAVVRTDNNDRTQNAIPEIGIPIV